MQEGERGGGKERATQRHHTSAGILGVRLPEYPLQYITAIWSTTHRLWIPGSRKCDLGDTRELSRLCGLVYVKFNAAYCTSGRLPIVHMQRVRKAPAGSFSMRLAMPPSTPAVTSATSFFSNVSSSRSTLRMGRMYYQYWDLG